MTTFLTANEIFHTYGIPAGILKGWARMEVVAVSTLRLRGDIARVTYSKDDVERKVYGRK